MHKRKQGAMSNNVYHKLQIAIAALERINHTAAIEAAIGVTSARKFGEIASEAIRNIETIDKSYGTEKAGSDGNS